MTFSDLYTISPEISMAVLAMLIVLLDLLVRRKSYLTVVTMVGLAVPLGLSVALWQGLDGASMADSEVVVSRVLAIGTLETVVVDKFSLFFKFLFTGVVAVVILVSNDYLRRFDGFHAEYIALLLFSATGMMLLASSVEMMTIYIALELSTLPLVALAAFIRDSRSSESGLKFLILSGISSAMLLYGMVLVYGFTGSTVLTDVAGRLAEMSLSPDQPFGSYALLMGVIMIVAGLGFKITAVPFHMWAPDVYEGSPTPVVAFLSVASKAAGFAVILRIFYDAFPLPMLSIEWSAIFAVLAALSMTLGNLVAIPQRNIKRMLAYSTVAHAGYIMVGLAAVTLEMPSGQIALGPSGVLFYLGGYAAMNLAAFSAVIAISNRIDSDHIIDYAGMGRRAPYLAAGLAFSMISLTGIPPTVGFMAKIYVFGAAVSSGLAWLAILGAINSVISAYYYLRVVKVMYLSPPDVEDPLPSGLPLRLGIVAITAGVLFFGVYPGPLLELARVAAQALVS